MSAYISTQEILKLPVYTELGTSLGRVVDIDCDTEDLRVERLHVQSFGLTGLFHEALIIHRSQIVRILPKKIIVDDAVVQKTEPANQTSADPV